VRTPIRRKGAPRGAPFCSSQEFELPLTQPEERHGLHIRLLLRLRAHVRQLRRDPRRLLAHREALSRVGGVVPTLGLSPRGAAAASGTGAGACARDRDRVHRHLSGHPAPAGPVPSVRFPVRGSSGGTNPGGDRTTDVVRRDFAVLVWRDLADDHVRRVHGGGLPGRDRGDPGWTDGGGALARDEPWPVDALRDRPAGSAYGDPAAAQRLHRADEGHLAGQRDRRARGGAGRIRHPDGGVQRLRSGSWRAVLPRGHDPAGEARRPPDRPPAAKDREGRWRRCRRGPAGAGANRNGWGPG
jgi:hypothetical protein